jgi:hypothetical protein
VGAEGYRPGWVLSALRIFDIFVLDTPFTVDREGHVIEIRMGDVDKETSSRKRMMYPIGYHLQFFGMFSH